MRLVTLVRIHVIAAALLAPPAAAVAQPAAPATARPYRALFGGDPGDRDALSLTVSLFGAYEDNHAEGADAGIDRHLSRSGAIAGATVSLTAQHTGDRASFAISGLSDLRYYPDLSDLTAVSYGASGAFMYRPWRRTTVRTSAALVWSPFYGQWFTPRGVGSGAIFPVQGTRELLAGDAAGDPRAMMSIVSADVGQALTRRTTAMGGYQFQYVDFEDDPRAERHHIGRAGVTHRITRYSTLRAEYGHRVYRLGSGEDRSLGDVRLGIDYSRPLSLSGRRTTFTIRPGTEFFRRQGRFELRLAGTATIRHDMGRTWSAEGTYRRGIRYLQGLDDQVFAGTWQAGITGLPSRRVQVAAGGSYSSGDQGERDLGFRAYSAGTRLTYALSRQLALYAQYIYMNYRLDALVQVSGTTPRDFERQGVSVGLTLWAPLIR